MVRIRLILSALICCWLSPLMAQAGSGSFTCLNAVILMADSTDAARFIAVPDDYCRSFSTFDVQGRFMDNKKHTAADYLAYAATNVRTWTTAEKEQAKSSFKEVEDFALANKLLLRLPDTVYLIKSTCMEEFGAEGYTRGNGIILKAGEDINAHLVAHELFHVLSRSNPALRDRLYENIGFKKCNPVDLTAAMNGLNITNPDCPVVSHYITIDGEDMVLVLYSKRPYTGGSVFEGDYINISLLVLEDKDSRKTPKMIGGKPVMYAIDKKSGLFDIVGKNTEYVLHPEEICAENFAALVIQTAVPEPQYLEKMKAVLTEQ